MKQVASGVWQLAGRLPVPHAINCFLLGEVLVDAGARFDGKKILEQLEGRKVTAHALTHAHPDHQGSSKLVCETLGIPFWVPEGEVARAERPELMVTEKPPSRLSKFFYDRMHGPGHPVDRRLAEGDRVGDFEVLEVPGHSPGHVVFWRESDRVLVLGDVLFNQDILTGIRGLREPRDSLTLDPPRNRRAAKRLGELEPSLVLFGHGPPLSDTRKFVDFCRGLPDE